ncbi:hypothetical protein SLEP1_g31632 [Rubroshorea leprosula]|uniref:Uncharacterized protein n=1 Tax=Rubroshorea leprosula TaxID=152421 RepID=A0AAV5K912_9ROSI|nr:hypothetical protein SLEP1_g31632 [Rubroshorea leprosula]
MECRKPALEAAAGSTGKKFEDRCLARAEKRRKAGSGFVAGCEDAFNAQRSSHLKIINVFKVRIAKPAQSFAAGSREKQNGLQTRIAGSGNVSRLCRAGSNMLSRLS